MKKYFNIIIVATIFIALLFTISCDNGLDGQGFIDDPTNTSTAPTANILGIVKLNSIYFAESDQSRYAGIYSNYISGVANQWVGINNYVYTPGDFDGLWAAAYVDGIKPARIAQSQGADEDDLEMVGTAQMFEALFLIEAAASWGDVPNTEAVDASNFPFPNYDSQLSVIQSAIALLNSAISNAGSSDKYINDGIGGITSNSTVGQIANSLKARAYMLIRDYSNAITSAQNGIQNNGDGMIAGHDLGIPDANNLYFQFLTIQRVGDTSPEGSYLEAMLNSTNASVSRSLDTPGDIDRYDFYYNSDIEFNTTDGVFAGGASMPIVSYYETKLVLAEALHRNSQEGAARNTLNEVRDALAAEFGGSFPHSTASGGSLLTHILEEKYISIFPSPQTFHDLARTDNALGVALKTGAVFPERFLYPQDEIDSNENAPNPIPDVFVPTPIN